jgi:NhaA family Na+:H+ antiporter
MSMARRHVRIGRLGKYLTPVGEEFVAVEALSGLAVIAGAVAAMVWVNLAPAGYADVWDHVFSIGPDSWGVTLDTRHWLNDGLMAIFFFVVGLEIKRELVTGELRDPKKAAVPVIAALGGMLVPAGIYLAVNAGTDATHGWGIPVATDIALAAGVLAILGGIVPGPLRLFLLTLAIADDIGAIIVIALFYSKGVDGVWLVAAVATVAVIYGMQRANIASPFAYVLPALLLWECVFQSGVHATIAGVVLGLLMPARPVRGRPVLEQCEHVLHPWSSFLIVPLFALANAGVRLGGDAARDALTSRVALGIVLGLVVGKPVGILLATALAQKAGVGRLPTGLTLRHVIGAGAIAGIGFTVALFVADLTFFGVELESAKVAVLAASVFAALLGSVVLATTRHERA